MRWLSGRKRENSEFFFDKVNGLPRVPIDLVDNEVRIITCVKEHEILCGACDAHLLPTHHFLHFDLPKLE